MSCYTITGAGLSALVNNEAFSTTADNNLGADDTIALTSGYGGTGYNATWVQDPDVGVVVECTKVPSHPCMQISHHMHWHASFWCTEWRSECISDEPIMALQRAAAA